MFINSTFVQWLESEYFKALKGPPRYNFFVQMHLVGLDMVRDAFLAPRLGRKVAVAGSGATCGGVP